MELTQSRSGDIHGYSLGDGTEHLLLPNPVKAVNMMGGYIIYQHFDCGECGASSCPVFPYKVEYPWVQFSHPQPSIPGIFPSPGSWMEAWHCWQLPNPRCWHATSISIQPPTWWDPGMSQPAVFISGTNANGAFSLDDCQPWKLWSRENKRGRKFKFSKYYYLQMSFDHIFKYIFVGCLTASKPIFGGLENGKGESFKYFT